MTNMNLIEAAVKTVIEFFEAEGIYEETTTIRNRVLDWYNHTDVTDSDMLAAAAISGNYNERLTYKELENLKNFYFKDSSEETYGYADWSIESNNISCEELKNMEADHEWW